MGDAPGRRAGKGPGFPHQHLWRRCPGRRDHDRSGAKRDGGKRHAASDGRSDSRADDAPVPTTLRTGRGWDDYPAARETIAARMGGNPPESFPATQDHPSLQFIRPLILHDPAPAIRQIQLPTLALFGELDNNILAEKNRAAWEAALTGRRPSRLHAADPAEGQSRPSGSEGWQQRRDEIAAAIRPRLLGGVLTWLSKHLRGLEGAK